MINTPRTVQAAQSLAGTTWENKGDVRVITRIEHAQISTYDPNTILADVYWAKPGGKERQNPTPLTTFRTWLNKAKQVISEDGDKTPVATKPKTQKVWNLMYVAGNPEMFSKVRANASNPLKRSDALASAKTVAGNGWRVWVEHQDTGERIFESEQEKNHQANT